MDGTKDMECECGRKIGHRMKGKCLACRYREARKKKPRIRILIDPGKLPEPPYAPTKQYRSKLPEKPREDEEPWDDELIPAVTEKPPKHWRMEAGKGAKNVPYTKEEDAEIKRMHREGRTCTEIAIKFGRTPMGIKQHLRKLLCYGK